MHCVTLADLAATLSKHGPSLLDLRPNVPSEVILRYWTASRSRHELWHRAMGRYRDAQSTGNYRLIRDWWGEHRLVLEEIIVSELLTRVVAAIGAESVVPGETPSQDESPNHNHDHLASESHESLAAVTHGVYVAQLEASNRVGRIILDGKGAQVAELVRLNRLRYGVERWTDWLIGRVSVNLTRGYDYCIDAERAKTFCDEIRETNEGTHDDTTTWLMNAAMRDMLVRRTSAHAALPQANHHVASSVLALFRPELFDSDGFPKSMWLQRLQDNAAKMKPFDFAAVSPG